MLKVNRKNLYTVYMQNLIWDIHAQTEYFDVNEKAQKIVQL